jgi:Fur family peroxide stress response transcriptional regulator
MTNTPRPTDDPEAHCAERLRDADLQVTRPRLAVYRVLADADDHPTASEIYERVRSTSPGVSMATVYNCLDALQEAGMVGVMNEVHQAARYDAVMERHHHLICRSCDQVVDLHDPDLDELAPADAGGFEVEDLSVHFYGLCPDCRGSPRGAGSG